MAQEAACRLNAADDYLARYDGSQMIADLESAVLQVRKALEAIAFASIAPNKPEYQALRAAATKAPDFTKDYHAVRIFGALERVNKNFYPTALEPGVRQSDGRIHFDKKESGVLSQSLERG